MDVGDNMIEIEETENSFTNVGNGIYAGLRKGGIMELSNACVEGQKMKPFVQFSIKRKPRITIRYRLKDFEDSIDERDNE